MKNNSGTGYKKKGLKGRKIQKLQYPSFHSTLYLTGGCKQTSWVEFRKRGASELLSKNTPVYEHTATSHSATEQPAPGAGHGSASTAAVCAAASYYDRKAMVVGEWAAVRTQLREATALTETAPSEPRWSSCNFGADVPVRCLDCEPKVMWCPPCTVQEHHVRPYHIMEQWTVWIKSVKALNFISSLKLAW